MTLAVQLILWPFFLWLSPHVCGSPSAVRAPSVMLGGCPSGRWLGSQPPSELVPPHAADGELQIPWPRFAEKDTRKSVADDMSIISTEVSEQCTAESVERLQAWQMQQLDQMQSQIQMMQAAVHAEQLRYAQAFQGLQGHVQPAYAVHGGGMGHRQPYQQCEPWQYQGYQQQNPSRMEVTQAAVAQVAEARKDGSELRKMAFIEGTDLADLERRVAELEDLQWNAMDLVGEAGVMVNSMADSRDSQV
eukprot:Skav206591  [mRNA]  locus=scaffold4512:1170:3335:- [translate_table: standard]